MRSGNGITILPPETDRRVYSNGSSTSISSAAAAAAAASSSTTANWSQSPKPDASQPRTLDRPSLGNLRASFRSAASAHSLNHHQPQNRPTTPDGPDHTTSLQPASPTYSSPRSIPSTKPDKRKPLLVATGSYDDHDHTHNRQPAARPRNWTMEGGLRQLSAFGGDVRQRVGSISSAGTAEDSRQNSLPDVVVNVAPHKEKKEKSSTTKRLVKRTSSHPPSPVISHPPCIDSLPLPIPTTDANKVLQLMKNLCGRMRGEIEYQDIPGAPWQAGIAYIDEEKGCLMFDPGHHGPFHCVLISDLKGCRVLPVDFPGLDSHCLELVTTQPATEMLMRPLIWEEIDLWLAALLCWQQMRPAGIRITSGRSAISPAPARPELKRHGSSWEGSSSKHTNIIKVGNVLVWDKGLASTPRAIVKRPSTRDLRFPTTVWRRISCTLHDNGEFRLLSDIDGTVLSVIELSQLSRCAVQQLDRTVFDEDHCIAIFPIYNPNATQLSIFRPVYISLDSREHYEVWFVLLRAFAMPDMFRIDNENDDQICDVIELDPDLPGDVFRLEKSIVLRITEAKINNLRSQQQQQQQQQGHDDNNTHVGNGGGKLSSSAAAAAAAATAAAANRDQSEGNYHAEVLLDGEVRARTNTKFSTKNPFWREDSEFADLPAAMPFLSVLLKKLDGEGSSSNNNGGGGGGGGGASPNNHNQYSLSSSSSQSSSKTAHSASNTTPREIVVGSVDIPLEQLDQGKDHEQWLQIFDEKQHSIGTMLVKIHYEELVVLLTNEYKSLSDILHKFPTGLTVQIASTIPGQLRRLAEIFLNIFQVTRSAGEWLMTLVEDEMDGIGNQTAIKKYRFSSRIKSNESVESPSDRELMVRDMSRSLAGEANLLFRGNSLLTQALEFHMRRLGKEYLEEVLRDKIFDINEVNQNCEVDPSKLQSGEDVSARWATLMQLTTEVWKCIVNSAERIPAELRHVLKYIRAVAEDRYGDFLRTVAYTGVSGFLFLRFICPAILSPKLFGLLRDHPKPRAQRTLTMVAKTLQKMANLSTFGKREEWMEPMNKFLNINRQSFRDFIDKVCSIPAERSVSAVPAPYSTPITILGRLSPCGKEGFPSLPYLVDHARSFAALVKLWTDANPLAEADLEVTEGELLTFNDICTHLQRRSDTCQAKLDALRSMESASASSVAYTAVDDIAASSSMDQMPAADQVSITYSGTTAGDDLRPPGSAGSDFDFGESNEGSSRIRSLELRPKNRAMGLSSSLRNVSSSYSPSSPPQASYSPSSTTMTTTTTPSHQQQQQHHAGAHRSGGRGPGRSTRTLFSGIMRMGRGDSEQSPTPVAKSCSKS